MLDSSSTSKRITEILILEDDEPGEGVETFTLELVEANFIPVSMYAYELSLPKVSMNIIDTSIFLRSNFSQLEVSIEDDDGEF